MNLGRRVLPNRSPGAVGAFAARPQAAAAPAPQQAQAPPALARAQTRLPPATITRIRVFYPPNYDRNGPQAFPQSNMVVLVDTDAGITGIGQGGSPDTVRNVARSVIGRNAFDTEMIWQAAFMDGFYSPGKERLHALGAIDLALWDIKGKALNAPLLSAVRRQGARAHRAVRDVRPAAGPRAAGGSGGDGAQGARGGDDGRRLSRVPRGQRHPAEPRRARRRAAPGRGARAAAPALRFAVAHPADHRGGRRRCARASGPTATG